MSTTTEPAATLCSDLWREAARLADHVAAALHRPPQQREASLAPDSPRWWDQSLSRGAAGVALLHAQRAIDGVGQWDTVDAWLRRATADALSATDGCGLWFGAPAVAFALEAGAPHRHRSTATLLRDTVERLATRRTALATARMDAARRPARAEYDLVRGLTGLGAYLLLGEPDRPALHAVLRYLVRLTEPLPADDPAGVTVPGWWTCDPPSRAEDPAFGLGQSDQGMAHGIAGPLALLALALRAGITVPGHVDAVERIVAWFIQHRRDTDGVVWWPEHLLLSDLPEPAAGPAGLQPQARQRGLRRPSWCYGIPGIARAHQLAALALGDTDRQADAEDALLRGVTHTDLLAPLTDPDLCHGWAGVLATLWCAAQDASTPALATRLAALLPVLLDHNLAAVPAQPCGLLTGPAGPALVLHMIATGGTGSWTRCLLLA